MGIVMMTGFKEPIVDVALKYGSLGSFQISDLLVWIDGGDQDSGARAYAGLRPLPSCMEDGRWRLRRRLALSARPSRLYRRVGRIQGIGREPTTRRHRTASRSFL